MGSLSSSSLASDDLAAAYQPRRVWAAGISIGWNLLFAAGFLASGGMGKLHHRLSAWSHGHHLAAILWEIPAYLAIFFLAYAAANYPLDLWFGYLEERQFGLAKDGIRAWTRDWIIGTAHHGLLFITGACLLLMLQMVFPVTWVAWAALALLGLFLLTSYFAAALLPRGLFQFEPADDPTMHRLTALAGAVSLPPVVIFTSASPRDFAGGIIGLGRRKVMLLSRSTLSAASDSVLRFVLRHDAGHSRYHHNLLATLAGWAWVTAGLVESHRLIEHHSHVVAGSPPYIACLALTLSLWMALGEPLLAYLGRRLEYQADRFYLRNGGTVAEMQTALEELSRRNLARTESQRRRETIFHPLPSVWNRLHAARRYAATLPESRFMAGAPIPSEGVP